MLEGSRRMFVFVLEYIASEAVGMRDHVKAIRVETGVGGWYPEVNVNGKPDTHGSK